jgi:hypothetical protein
VRLRVRNASQGSEDMKGQSGSDDTPATAAGLRPEARLLVLSAGKPGRGDEAGEVGRLVGGVRDWDGLIDTAVRHGVASLLHALFDWSGTISGVPEPARERLKKIYYATVLRNEQIKGQLLDILRAFREAAIDTLLLKGLFVLGSLYEDSGQRPIGDIDLLLRSDDVTGGDKVMRKMGYSLRAGSMPLGFYRRVHFHVVYHRSHSRSQVPVELH